VENDIKQREKLHLIFEIVDEKGIASLQRENYIHISKETCIFLGQDIGFGECISTPQQDAFFSF